MGNKLVSSAPSSVLSIESYIALLPDSDLVFLRSLSSTRLCRVTILTNSTRTTICLMKVYPIYDASLPYADFILCLQARQRKLDTFKCSVSYDRFFINAKAVYVIRYFSKTTLRERMTSKPRLTKTEKDWIAFQLLKSIDAYHNNGIYHGDIKTENVLLTSWNKMFLADLATFKPTYLPSEDPSVYYYFFVSGQGECCTLAPERFVEHVNTEDGIIDTFDNTGTGAMDIFSLGCVLYELYSERPLFTLSSLLKYRASDVNDVSDIIDDIKANINSTALAQLVSDMVTRDPRNRPSAKDCASRKLDMSCLFGTFLHEYANSFCSPQITCEDIVRRIHTDWHSYLRDTVDDPCTEVLVLILLSCSRDIKLISTKLMLVELLKNACIRLQIPFIEDRLLPHCVYLLSPETENAVRIRALDLLTTCLELMHSSIEHMCAPGLFSDYLMPQLDMSTVHQFRISRYERAFFTHLPTIAGLCLKLLERSKSVDESEEVESWFQTQLMCCIREDHNFELTVRCLNSSLEGLHNPLSMRKTFLFIVSHLATIPNKFAEDWRSRVAFFKCASTLCVLYDGNIASNFLRTFLYQGIMDSNPIVVCTALKLLDRCLFHKVFQRKCAIRYISIALVHQIHPIRDVVRDIIYHCHSYFSATDFSVYISPMISSTAFYQDPNQYWSNCAVPQWQKLSDPLVIGILSPLILQGKHCKQTNMIARPPVDIDISQNESLTDSSSVAAVLPITENDEESFIDNKMVDISDARSTYIKENVANLVPYMELAFSSGDNDRPPLLRMSTNGANTVLTLDAEGRTKEWHLSQIDQKILFKSSRSYAPLKSSKAVDVAFNDQDRFTLVLVDTPSPRTALEIHSITKFLVDGSVKLDPLFGTPVQTRCDECNTVHLLTNNGQLITVDNRCLDKAVQMQMQLSVEHGFATTFMVDKQCFVVGTDKGSVQVFDRRFPLLVDSSTIYEPSQHQNASYEIRNVLGIRDGIVGVTFFNSNHVILWDFVRHCPTSIFRACTNVPLKYDSTTAIYNLNGKQLLMTGYDCRIRSYDVYSSDCALLIPKQKGEDASYRMLVKPSTADITDQYANPSIWDVCATLTDYKDVGATILYRQSLQDGVICIDETILKADKDETFISAKQCQLHCNFVTDMLCITDDQGGAILSTVAMDGLLKLWRPRNMPTFIC